MFEKIELPFSSSSFKYNHALSVISCKHTRTSFSEATNNPSCSVLDYLAHKPYGYEDEGHLHTFISSVPAACINDICKQRPQESLILNFCRLAVVFLAFDVFFAIFCVVLACLVGIALCCCLPCIIAILYAVAGQV
jgi:hypothetical protein